MGKFKQLIVNSIILLSPLYSMHAFSMHQQTFDVKKNLTKMQQESVAVELDRAFDNPENFDATLEVLSSLPDDGGQKIVYVEQFGYATSKEPTIFRTGLVSTCVVMTIYNPQAKPGTPKGSLLHLAAENYGYLMTGLMSDEELKDNNMLQRLLNYVSDGEPSNLHVNLFSGSNEAIALWKRYLEFFGVNTINSYYFPEWNEGKTAGRTMDQILTSVKTNGLKRGFVQFSCEDGSIAVTHDVEQFRGKIFFAGASPFTTCSIVSNQSLITFYSSGNFQLKWTSWPGQKRFK